MGNNIQELAEKLLHEGVERGNAEAEKIMGFASAERDVTLCLFIDIENFKSFNFREFTTFIMSENSMLSVYYTYAVHFFWKCKGIVPFQITNLVNRFVVSLFITYSYSIRKTYYNICYKFYTTFPCCFNCIVK